MNLLIPIVGLILLCDFSQTLQRTVIVQWPNMHTYFEKLFDEEKYPSKNLFISTLCWHVTNSKVYIIKYKKIDTDSYEFPDSEISHEVRPKNLSSGIWKILGIENSNSLTTLPKTKVSVKGYDPLEMNVCHLDERKEVYVSRGIRVEYITLHFLVGLTKSGMEVLGAFGMADVTTVNHEVAPEDSVYNEKSINRRLVHISPLQRIWFGPIVKSFETRTEPHNYKITILHSTEDLAMTALLHQYDNLYPGSLYMQYEVLDVDDDFKEETIIILPDKILRTRYYFYYKKDLQLVLKYIFIIRFY